MLYSTESFAYQNRLAGFTPFWRDRLGTHTATPGKVRVRGGRNAVLHRAVPPSAPTRCECGPGPSGVPRVEPYALPEPFLTPPRADVDALRDGTADVLVGAPMRRRIVNSVDFVSMAESLREQALAIVDEGHVDNLSQRMELIDLNTFDADSVMELNPAGRRLRRQLDFSMA